MTIQSFYLPFAFLAITVLMGGSPVLDICGIIAGHLWYFFTVLYPQSSGRWAGRGSVEGLGGQARGGAACRARLAPWGAT